MASIKQIKTRKGIGYKIGFTDPSSGKWSTRTVYCSKNDANRILKKIEKDKALGIFNIKSNNSSFFTTMIKIYLKNILNEKSPLTIKRDKIVLNNFKSFIGSKAKVDTIDHQLINRYKNHRLYQTSKQTVSLEIRHLKAIFNYCIKLGFISKNPFLGIKLPKKDPVNVRFLKKEECDKLLKTIKSSNNINFYHLIKAYLHTGARRIELLSPNFTWNNVDFINKQIKLKGKGDKWRTIPMNDTLYDTLKKVKDTNIKVPFSYNPDYVTKKTSIYMKKAGIMDASLHNIRKTFGSTILMNNGGNLYVVSKLLGHSSIKTTEEYYVDILTEDLRDSVNTLTETYPNKNS